MASSLGSESRGGPPLDIIHTAPNARNLDNLDCASKGVRALTGIQTDASSAAGVLLDGLTRRKIAGSLTENVCFFQSINIWMHDISAHYRLSASIRDV